MNFGWEDAGLMWQRLLDAVPDAWEPWIALVVKIGAILSAAPLIMMYLTWFERKVLARFQNRYGPDRVGLYGLAQPLADGLKMLLKEDVAPAAADRFAHTLAPVLSLIPAMLLFAVIPFGKHLVASDLNIGLLYALAVGAVGSMAIFIGGWASRSKYPLLGAMRTVAQIISYEVPQVVAVVCVIMITGTLSLVGIVEAQAERWFITTPWGFAAALIFFLCGVAEVNRTPFDLSEAESELVGGFHTEYSGMKFALWYMAEFLESFAVCAFTATLFLGGWQGPAVPNWSPLALLIVLLVTAKRPSWPIKIAGTLVLGLALALFGAAPVPSWAWFLTKTYALMFVLVWFRGTLPRLRMDQLMGLAWKFFLPLSLLNIAVAALWFFEPGWRGWAGGALALLAGAAVLIRANRPEPMKPRFYIFAE